MIWVVLALATAFFTSLVDLFGKKSLKNVDEYVASWSLKFFAFIFLFPLLFFISIPDLGKNFWLVLIFTGLWNTMVLILYVKAIKHSDLSLTAPMVTFTPLFLLITSPLIVHEFPNAFGMFGIFLIVLGAYMLNIKEKHNGFLAPFKALLRERGPRLMLLVAFLFSIGSNLDKIGIINSSPIFWTISMNSITLIFLFIIMYFKSRDNIKLIRINYKTLLPMGFFSALSLTAQMAAINLTLVANVISIKRTSAILSVLYGYFIFKEKGIKERLVGVIIMIVGVLVITLFS